MKRSNFLKALLGIAVAPIAIAKAIEQCDVKPENYGLKIAREIEKERKTVKTLDGTKIYKRFPLLDEAGQYPWYEGQEDRVNKLLKHYGKMSLHELGKEAML